VATCYISLPFGKKLVDGEIEVDFDYLYHSVIKPCLVNSGFTVSRGDELKGGSFIGASLFSAIAGSDLMIADLSCRNPNVLYELGVRHGVRSQKTLMIANAREALPYDLRNFVVRRYYLESARPSAAEVRALQEHLAAAIKEGEERKDSHGSPLHESLGASGNLNRWEVATRPTSIFIGHGRNPVWLQLRDFVRDTLQLPVRAFESTAHAGQPITEVLLEELRLATFAMLVLTGEDSTAEGNTRARQNVIHEAGLFQGRLGFERAILVMQKGVEEFTNVAGLQDIRFDDNNIGQTFGELVRVLRREGIS
jgi:predicted nucleotide-binding protein